MNSIEGIVKLVENEFEAMARNGKFRSREEIDTAYKLMDIVKDAHCIWKYEDEEADHSEEGRSYDGSYSPRYGRAYRSYEDGRSEARRRDSMGRYASSSKQEYIDELREMMESAPDEHTRQGVQRLITRMERA